MGQKEIYQNVIGTYFLELKLKDFKATTPYGFLVAYGRPASEHRFFLINIKSMSVEYSWWTSHGSGSGTVSKAVNFSNVPNSKMSSLGVVRTGETYQSAKVGFARKLDGLEFINDRMRDRGIVLHSGKYVTKNWVDKYGCAGRSEGCIVLDPSIYREIIGKLEKGSLGVLVDKLHYD